MKGDPVFQENGQWWFWDETWTNKHGPYQNEDHSRGMLCIYCEYLDHPKHEPASLLERCIIFGGGALFIILVWVVTVAAYRYFTN